MATDTPITEAIIGPVRLSYLSVFAPRMNNAKQPPAPEFGALLLIPKEPTPFCPNPEEVLAKIREMIKNSGKAKFGEAKGWKAPLKDGDKIEEGYDAPRDPGYWTLRVSARPEYPPVLVDGRGMTANKDAWESGDWGKVKVKFWAYDTAGNKGVSGGLRAVQFLYKDEALGSSNSPTAIAAEFGTVADAHAPAGATEGDGYDPFEND